MFVAINAANQFAELLVAAGAKTEIAEGFTLYMIKTVVSGRGDDLIDLAQANLRQ